MHCNRTVIALLLLTSSLGHAQDTTLSEPETIQKLVQQVKELQDEVKQLESQRASAANQTAASQPAGGPAPADEKAGNTQPESLAQELHELHGIQWRGFGEANYKVLNQRTPELGTFGFVPGSTGNFYTGDFDLLLTARISDKASVLSEIVFGEQDAQKFGVDLERVLFKYDYNDHLRMSFGRYHTGTSTPVISIYCLLPESTIRRASSQKSFSENRMPRNSALIWNVCCSSTTTTII